jgi:hypothetical protein
MEELRVEGLATHGKAATGDSRRHQLTPPA